jgi:multiple sugar transport system substrate-binding protein
MKLSSRKTTAVAVLAVTTLALAACGSGASGGSGGAGGDSKVSYMTWESQDTNQALDTSFATWSKTSGITMDRQDAPNADYAQKLASLILSKKAPDFFWCSTTQEQNLASEGLLYDWSDYINGNKGLDASKFSPGALDLFTGTDKKIYGIPTLANTYGVFYNADLFKAAGVALPKAGWTYDEMLADAKALKGVKGSKGAPLVTGYPMLDTISGLSAYSVANGGAPVLDKSLGATKATASAQFVDGVGKYAAAIKAGELTGPNLDTSNAIAIFSNGATPMLFGGQWFAATITGKKVNWGFAPWPVGTASNQQPIEANGVCSPSTIKNPDQVFKAISYMDSTGFNSVMQSVPLAPIAYTPGSQGYYDSLQKQGGAYATIADTAKYELAAPDKFVTQLLDPWATKAADIQTAVLWAALDGKSTPQAGSDDTVKQIQSLIDSQH